METSEQSIYLRLNEYEADILLGALWRAKQAMVHRAQALDRAGLQAAAASERAQANCLTILRDRLEADVERRGLG